MRTFFNVDIIFIDDSDDDGEPDVPKPKNLFGSAKDAVMSIVKKAAEAFSAGKPHLNFYTVTLIHNGHFPDDPISKSFSFPRNN
jgi:hypothetical protein